MSYGVFGSNLGIRPYGGEQASYEDNSIKRRLDSGDIEAILRSIRENCGSSCAVVFVGEEAKGSSSTMSASRSLAISNNDIRERQLLDR